jgi:hypothetical protein
MSFKPRSFPRNHLGLAFLMVYYHTLSKRSNCSVILGKEARVLQVGRTCCFPGIIHNLHQAQELRAASFYYVLCANTKKS